MKIAANELERTLSLAQAESRAEVVTSGAPSASLATLVSAFRRAAELFNRTGKMARVRGRKSGKSQTVEVLIDRKEEHGNDYALCLFPYNERERAGRRRKSATYIETQETVDGKLRKSVRAILPTHAHTQWVREDRLEHIS